MTTTKLGNLAGAIAAVSLLGASAAHAVTFAIDPNPGGTQLYLNSAKSASSSFGTVLSTNDVAISVTGNGDFANGFSSIKPIKDGTLTELVFTPVDPNAFDAFSFRGQDLVAGQVIDVIVQDNQGNAPVTLQFTEGGANQNFSRDGVIAALTGETIKSVEIVNSGGFKEAKQFEFLSVGSNPTGVPEPATWAVMLIGFGAIGAKMRHSRRQARLA